jgi:capsular exopolysaccharide synthesis family protein
MRKDETLELGWFFEVIRRWAWLIVGCTLLALVVALVVTSRMPPAYEATTTLLVAPAEQTSTTEYSTLMAGERLALTYGQMLKGRSTLQTVISRLGLDETPEALSKRIRTEPVKDTQLIRVTARDTSPARAALVANTIAEIFIDYANALQEERFRDDILSKEAKIGVQRKAMEEAQAQIDAVSANKVPDETELVRLQGLLADYRNTSRTLQQDHQSLQLLVERVKNSVRVVEPARMPAAYALIPNISTVLLLVDQGGVNPGTGYSDVLASEQLAGTYAQMMVGPSVLAAAIASLGSGQSPDALAARVKAAPIAGTQLVRLQVAGADASQTARQANAIAQAFVDQIQEMLAKPYAGRLADMQDEISRLSTLIDDTQAEIQVKTAAKLRNEGEMARLQGALAENRSDYRTLQQDFEQLRLNATRAVDTVVVSERAHVPEAPVRGRGLYILLAVAIAAVGAVGAAFLIEYFDDTIKTPEDIGRGLGVATVGMISRFAKADGGLIGLTHPNSPPAEAFRVLAANLRFAAADAPLRSLVVTSAVSGEGKSEVVANLAVAMAGTGVRVIAVDADLRRPRLHHLFGLPQGRGLTESLLLGKFEGNLRDTQVDGLQVLTSGALPADPVQLISSPRMAQLLIELTHRADVVIVDSPPVLGVAEATIMAAESDGVLLVLCANRTSRQAAQHAIEALRRAKSRLVGAVLNGVPATSNDYYRYYSQEDEPKRFTGRLPLKWAPWEWFRRPSPVRPGPPQARE